MTNIYRGDTIQTNGGHVIQGDQHVTNITEEVAYNVYGLLPNPYLGLEPLTYGERKLYAGRADEVRAAADRLMQPNASCELLFITGASGSGKSSFAQAGLVPELEKRYAQRHQMVSHAVVQPGTHWAAQLRVATEVLGLPKASDVLNLASTDAGRVFVLILDQFEDFFTESSEAQRKEIFEKLLKLPRFDQSRLHIVATLRTDFLDELQECDEKLYDLAAQSVDLQAMSVDALKEAILAPLRNSGFGKEKRFEPALLDRLAQDAHGQTDYLPLLQVTLKALWKKGSLKLSAYANSTLTDAIRKHGEDALLYEDFGDAVPQLPRPPAEQAIMLDMLLALIKVPPDGDEHQIVCQSRSKADLLQGLSERAALFEPLVKANLISVQSAGQMDEQVDLIHKTLITNWERLIHAIEAQRPLLQQRTQFEGLLKEWQNKNKRDDCLLYGVRLAEARALSDAKDIALQNQDAPIFLTRSLDLVAKRQRRVIAGLAALVVLALMATGFAIYQTIKANTQKQEADHAKATAVVAGEQAKNNAATAVAAKAIADSENKRANEQTDIVKTQSLAAQAAANRENELDLSFLLGIEALRVTTTVHSKVEARSALVAALQQAPRLKQYGHAHAGAVFAVAYSPVSQTLASGDENGTVILWDTGDSYAPKIVATLPHAYTTSVWSLAFSPDGNTLATGDSDGTLSLWDVRTVYAPQKVSSRQVHTGGVTSLAFSPSRTHTTLATGGIDKTVILWDLQHIRDPKKQGVLNKHTGGVLGLAFTNNGETLASSSEDGSIILWNVSDSNKPTDIRSLKKDEPQEGVEYLVDDKRAVYCVAFSQDGNTLASGYADGTVVLWDVSILHERAMLFERMGNGYSVRHIAFSPAPGSTILAYNYSENAIGLWDVSDLNELQPLGGQPLKAHSGGVWGVAFSPDGATLASGSDDHTVIFWDATYTSTHSAIANVYSNSDNRTAWSVAFLPNSARNIFALGESDGSVTLWDIGKPDTPEKLSDLTGLVAHTGQINSVAFSLDKKLLASASDDRTVILWDVSNLQTPKQLQVLAGHEDSVRTVAFSGDSKLLASGSDDQSILLWDVSNVQQPIESQKLIGHTASVQSIAFRPPPMGTHSVSNNKVLAAGDLDGFVILWDVSDPKSYKKLRGFKTHKDAVRTIAFSPDGNTLASGGDDRTIILWDVTVPRAAKPLGLPLKTHMNQVYSVAFSPDGRTLAAGGWNDTITLWDVSDRNTPRVMDALLKGHTASVLRAAFSPDGKTLISSSFDNTVIAWELDVEAWIRSACQMANRNLSQPEWQRYFANDPYRKTCLNAPIHPSVVEEGRRKAKDESMQAAVVWFQGLKQLDADLTLDPDQEARIAATKGLFEKATELSQEGKPDAALKKIEEARDIMSGLPLSVENELRRLVVPALIAPIYELVKSESITQALGLYQSIVLYDPDFEKTAPDDIKTELMVPLNNLCWDGSLRGYAKDVLAVCEKAVLLAAESGDIRDSRGLARALTGDYAGAIEDFKAYIAWAEKKTSDPSSINMRKGWIEMLQAGTNPFNSLTLERLKDELPIAMRLYASEAVGLKPPQRTLK